MDVGFEDERGLGFYTPSRHTSMPKRKNRPVSVLFVFAFFLLERSSFRAQTPSP